MTDPNYTAICLVVDRSGSMNLIREDAEGGINAFIAEQAKAEGKRTVRLVTFDTEYTQVHPSIPAADVPPFELHPRGGTALLDAMGRGIVEFGEELAAMPEDERPGNVVFAVMTDGYENSSQEWTLARVKELVEHQQKTWKWNIAYLGANQDAIKEGAKYGFAAGSSITYEASSAGTRGVTDSLNAYVASSASGIGGTFTDENREAAKQK